VKRSSGVFWLERFLNARIIFHFECRKKQCLFSVLYFPYFLRFCVLQYNLFEGDISDEYHTANQEDFSQRK